MAAGPDPANGAVSNHRRRRFDVRVVPHRRRSPFRLRDWRMSTKLATVLLVPSMAFLLLAGVQTSTLVGRTTALNDFSSQVGIGRQITAAVHQLQQERDRSAGELGELRKGGDRQAAANDLKPLQAATDKAIVDLSRAAEPLADADASWRVAFSEALEAYDQVVDIRSAIPPAVLSTETILSNYHRAVGALLDLLAEPTPGQNQPALNDAVLRYVQLARVKELSSRVRGQLYAAARAGAYGTEDRVVLADLRGQQLTALGAFRVAATSAQIRRYDETSVSPSFLVATGLEERSLSSGAASPQVLPSEQWWSASQQRQELLRQLEAGVLDDAVRQAEDASDDQLRTTLLVVGGVVTVLLAALLISLLIGRSVARSMRLLRSQALRIAQVELPDALDRLKTVTGGVPRIDVAPAVVRSLDEIGELAEAFVAVHRSAVTVAVEQALMRRNVNAMFVNLARRSQVLVERQLELLDDLEREESDPDQLENLFKLDHLAARMRRNDESLLVLAGTDSTRRWNRPVGLGAVLLAAAAEIEQYQRVRIESVADVHVVGHAVGESVHLLAELLENATAFSRPDTVVVVTARVEAGGALIEIVDRGLGMSPTALVQANEVLASPPAADVAAVERMGLFVVSHLAARLGVRVRLEGGEDGLVARLALPAVLLAPAGSVELDAPPSARMLAASAARGLVPQPGAARQATAPMSNGAVRDLPVAGRPPGVGVPRQGRPVPVRAEDVLTPAAARGAGGGWYSRQGPTAPVVPAAAAPPTIPVTAGTNERGLPVRVPMAQLSAVTRSAQPMTAPTRTDPDPEAVGGMLSRLYSGVRRAEAEDTTEIPVPPSGGHDEGGRRQ
ncbi:MULTISPECIES: sensor histidine kinase [Micromonospora]|uniref:sensor histidine kinase n=1 Tax=Micromonospora TaxID=1873 RepID=UPI001EE808DE|nr:MULTISPECIES: nitrate- and nitrite sensing domain-containing protein [Micromonospora]MCG5452404.1 nitrate- and nitrite sensing domain-containing protein [Micromonospora hortensis]MCX5121701.1 nitrate- and nitrite sensing domain-containing protein [Micromonospora sp. NBC_00362]WTI06359.1 nitrate- and nitrite sensing domain-containing protein [Micromonospora sp. NBC_00821]